MFVLGAQTHFVTAYLAPGILVGGLFSPAIPAKFVYWVEPNGGPTVVSPSRRCLLGRLLEHALRRGLLPPSLTQERRDLN